MSPESILLFQNAGSALVALFVVASLWLVFSPMLEGDKKKKRLESVASARDVMRKTRLSNLQAEASLRSDNKGFAKSLVDRFSLESLLGASDLKDKMAQAGLRGQKPVYIFYMTRMIAPIVLGVLGLLFLIILNIPDWKMMQRVTLTMGLIVFGYYLPGIWVKNLAGKRLTSIIPVFPDALDLLLICVESGMSGRMAYENLARRNNHPGIRAVATALVQAERYGTPLGDTLRTMAHENRQLRVMQAEKKAAALPAKLTVPMILFFLPVLFIVILTPAAMKLSTAF